MDYKIQPHSYEQANKLGVKIKPSKKKDKKIDVFKNNKLVSSIGQLGYKDYGTYIKEKGKPFADKRRSLYKSRHAKDSSKIGTPGFYANKILW